MRVQAEGVAGYQSDGGGVRAKGADSTGSQPPSGPYGGRGHVLNDTLTRLLDKKGWGKARRNDVGKWQNKTKTAALAQATLPGKLVAATRCKR